MVGSHTARTGALPSSGVCGAGYNAAPSCTPMQATAADPYHSWIYLMHFAPGSTHATTNRHGRAIKWEFLIRPHVVADHRLPAALIELFQKCDVDKSSWALRHHHEHTVYNLISDAKLPAAIIFREQRHPGSGTFFLSFPTIGE